MPLSHGEQQSCFLYNRKWNTGKDSLLINSLLSKKEACKPLLPTDSPHAIVYAMDALNDNYKAGVRVIDVAKRIEFLRKRCLTFKELTNKPETNWELPRNVVTADDSVWPLLLQEKSFFQAYRHKGEPEYFKLAQLFGLDDVTREMPHTVIEVEDDSEGEDEASTEILEDTSSEDEVISPAGKAAVNVVRKLFDDGASSSVPQAAADYPTNNNAPWLQSQLNYGLAATHGFPPRNAFPTKPKDNENTPDAR